MGNILFCLQDLACGGPCPHFSFFSHWPPPFLCPSHLGHLTSSNAPCCCLLAQGFCACCSLYLKSLFYHPYKHTFVCCSQSFVFCSERNSIPHSKLFHCYMLSNHPALFLIHIVIYICVIIWLSLSVLNCVLYNVKDHVFSSHCTLLPNILHSMK